MNTVPSSPPSASDETERQLTLLRQNIQLAVDKTEQMASVLGEKSDALDATRRDLTTTMELAQQMIANQDQALQRLENAVAALVKLYQLQNPKRSPTGS